MNFKYMPELEWRWGYPTVWIAVILIGVSMLIYSKKRDGFKGFSIAIGKFFDKVFLICVLSKQSREISLPRCCKKMQTNQMVVHIKRRSLIFWDSF